MAVTIIAKGFNYRVIYPQYKNKEVFQDSHCFSSFKKKDLLNQK